MGAHPGEKQVLKLLEVDAVAWAVNMGGKKHQSRHGVTFDADMYGGEATGSVAEVLGAQDPTIYQTYRMGELDLEQQLANGTYDLTFYFVEPEGAAPGDRVFDVVVQGETVVHDLDISLSRSSSAPSALKRTVTGVEVKGGVLHVQLKAVRSTPVLSGLVARSRQVDVLIRRITGA